MAKSHLLLLAAHLRQRGTVENTNWPQTLPDSPPDMPSVVVATRRAHVRPVVAGSIAT